MSTPPKIHLFSGCFQCVKGNKFESDSQLPFDDFPCDFVVSNVSKVINLKAIHNTILIDSNSFMVVSNVSKIANLTIFFVFKKNSIFASTN